MARPQLERHDGGACGRSGFWVIVVEQQRLELGAHVPFDVVGEHAQEDMRAHPVAGVVVDGTHLEVHGLEAAEGTLDGTQALVGAHGLRGIQSASGTLVRTTYRPSSAASAAISSALRW